MFIDADIDQTGILVPLELEDGIIHQGAIEDAKTDEMVGLELGRGGKKVPAFICAMTHHLCFVGAVREPPLQSPPLHLDFPGPIPIAGDC